LDFQDPLAEEETPEESSGFELKTTTSNFEFKLPTVFDSYENTQQQDQIEHDTQEAIIPSTEKNEEASFEDQLMKTKERILRLKELSMKLKSSNGLQELETEPAYKRKQKVLDEVPHSSQSQVSRFTLSFDDGETEIKSNNSFLHDNVD